MPLIAGMLLVPIAGVFLIFIGAILGTLAGALGGYIVQMFFASWIVGGLHQLGFSLASESAVWQLGALFGFMGGFFRSSVSTTSK